jgi:hypothetical protein
VSTLDLDVSNITLPSDQVTVGQIRRIQPELFSPAMGGPIDDVYILAVLSAELLLAEKAYAKAAGLPDPWPDWPRKGVVDSLDEDYRRYGLSTGLKQTHELVRNFERQVAKQAEGRHGPSTGR